LFKPQWLLYVPPGLEFKKNPRCTNRVHLSVLC